MSYRKVLRAFSRMGRKERNALYDLYMWTHGGKYILSYYTIQDYQNDNWYDFDVLERLEKLGLIKQFYPSSGDLVIALTDLGRKVGRMVVGGRTDFEGYTGVFKPPPWVKKS